MSTTSTEVPVSVETTTPIPTIPAARPRIEDIEPRKGLGRTAKRLAIVAFLLMALLSLAAGMAKISANSPAKNDKLVFFTVRTTTLPITVTERGTLGSQNNEQIICEVDDIRGDGINGTPIIWIVENGVSVKEGDLLVELDSASHLERLDEQTLKTEQARAKFTEASIHYENRQSRNDTEEAEAQLDVDLAGLSLEQYEDERGGTYQIELQNIELSRQQAEERRKIDESNLQGMLQLHDLGYKSKGDLAQARLRSLRAESALKREKARQRELTKYSYQRSKLRLQGDQDSTKRKLIQVRRNNEALLAQAKAWNDSAEASLEREEERLARYREQLEKCKIYATQDGMVAYAVEGNRHGQGSSVGEGVAVRDRQPLLSLPDLRHMQVKTAVHESVVDSVKAGLKATIRMDAFPDRIYSGSVKEVAVLPDPGDWLSSDTKVYKTIVTIDEEVEQLKPGMTAAVEIHIDKLRDVLCVPIQAMVQRGAGTWCFVIAKGQVEKRPVTYGPTNDKYVQIVDGVSEGDIVVLNPTAILEENPLLEQELSPDNEQPEEVSLD